VVYSASSTVYTSKAVDTNTGLPLAANAVIASVATNLASCWIPIIVTDPSGAQTSVNANLVNLEPVAPIWNTTATTEHPEGVAYATPVGEALLVAPGAPSYEMTLTYKRWKKTSTTDYSEIEGTVTKSIARNTASALFEAGKSYNVVITLYKDGDAATDTNLEQWQSGDTDINIEGEE
jgi:hypothetical protein